MISARTPEPDGVHDERQQDAPFAIGGRVERVREVTIERVSGHGDLGVELTVVTDLPRIGVERDLGELRQPLGSEVIAEQDQRRVAGLSVAEARDLAREGAEARQVDEREAAPPDEPGEVSGCPSALAPTPGRAYSLAVFSGSPGA